MKLSLSILCLVLLSFTASGQSTDKPPEVIVTESKRYDSTCLNLKIGDIEGFVVKPTAPAADGSKPWLWYAPTLGSYRDVLCVRILY